MSRSRIPNSFAILQLTFRCLTLAAELGCLITTLYISLNFAKTNPMLYVALLWFIIIDNAEIIALTARHGDGVRRTGLCALLTLEVLGLVFFLISFFVSFVGQIGEDIGEGVETDEPGANYMVAQWFLIFAIMGVHFFMMIVCCIDGWIARRTQPRRIQNHRSSENGDQLLP